MSQENFLRINDGDHERTDIPLPTTYAQAASQVLSAVARGTTRFEIVVSAHQHVICPIVVRGRVREGSGRSVVDAIVNGQQVIPN